MGEEGDAIIRKTWENAHELAVFLWKKFYEIPWGEFGEVDVLMLMMALEILAGANLFVLCRELPEFKDSYISIFRTISDGSIKVAEKAESFEL